MLGIWAGYSLQSNKGKTSTFDFHLFAPVCLLMSHHLSSFLPPAISCNAKDQNGVAQPAPPQQRIARQLQDITRWGGFGKALADADPSRTSRIPRVPLILKYFKVRALLRLLRVLSRRQWIRLADLSIELMNSLKYIGEKKKLPFRKSKEILIGCARVPGI